MRGAAKCNPASAERGSLCKYDKDKPHFDASSFLLASSCLRGKGTFR